MPRSPLLRKLRPESDKLLHLDMLRFFASVAIVVTHFRAALMSFSTNADAFQPYFYPLGAAVDLFFVISGFVISWVYCDRIDSSRSYLDFIRRRIARLGPLHWATLLFFTLVGIFALARGIQLDTAAKYDWRCLPSNILLIHAWQGCSGTFNTVSWSISAELAMYLLFPILLTLVRRRLRVAGLLVVGLLVLGIAAPRWTTDYPFVNTDIRRALQGFLFGILLFAGRTHVMRLPYPGLVMTAAAALIVAGVVAEVERNWLIPLVYLVAVAAIASDLAGSAGVVVRTLAPLGQLTYSMYMLHPVVQSLALTLVGEKILGLSGLAMSAWALLWIPLTGVLGYFSLMLFENPSRRWLSGSSGREAKREYVTAP